MSLSKFARSMITIITLVCISGLASGAVAAEPISAADLIQGKKPARDIRPVFDLFDENRDQRVDQIEFRVWIVAAFEKLDKNNDNHLSPSELPSIGSYDFSNADSNGDGRLSAFEFTDSRIMKFARFDTNNDGYITFEEALERRRQSGG